MLVTKTPPPGAFKFVAGAALSALGWIAIATLNRKIFGTLERAPGAHWIFLPAGFRPLAVLLFNKAGAVGLAVGTWVTVTGSPGTTHAQALAHALVNGGATWAGVTLSRWAMGLPPKPLRPAAAAGRSH
jgi:hypothetical protein